MKHKILKVLACISLVAMVLSAVTPGAFADESGTADEAKQFGNQKMGHGPHAGPGMGCEGMAVPVFDTEDEEMEFLVERETENINQKIEMLEGMLGKIDEIGDENITEESIEERISELEDLLEDIESATTLDELKEILEEYRENNPRPEGHGRGHGPMGPAPEPGGEVTEE